MDVMRDIEHVMGDHDRLFDAWEAGGVDGLVIGPLLFGAPDLLPGPTLTTSGPPGTATFVPNKQIYQRLGVDPPGAPDPSPEAQAMLEGALLAAKDRGWSVWIFQPSAGAGSGGGGHVFGDEKTRAALCARMVDTLERYPMADGGIMDGPEWGYEIAPHHMSRRSYIFDDLPESIAPKCADLGYDYAALVAAKDRLYDCLHGLQTSRIALHAAGGFLGGFHLLGGDPDLSAWLRFRVEALTDFFQAVHTCVTSEVSRPVRLGVGPRSAAFAPLCGYDLSRLAEFMDLLLPKHYFWHRGFDGLLGTVYRYVETLTDWNPGLTDSEALDAVGALFGLVFPDVRTRNDLEAALTPGFLNEITTRETRRALAVVDDPERIVPWVEAGRAPHNGDPISASQLQALLQAAGDAGLRRFLYHHHGNLTDGEWAVISATCGRVWNSLESGYRPPDRSVL